jgi:hypothetical protein
LQEGALDFRTRVATSIRVLPRLRQKLRSQPIKISPTMLLVPIVSLWPLVSPPALQAQTHGRSGASLRIMVNVAPAILNVSLDQANKSIVIRDATTQAAGQFLIWPDASQTLTLVEEVRTVCESGWQGDLLSRAPISTGTVLVDLRKSMTLFERSACAAEAGAPTGTTVEGESLVLTRTFVSR